MRERCHIPLKLPKFFLWAVRFPRDGLKIIHKLVKLKKDLVIFLRAFDQKVFEEIAEAIFVGITMSAGAAVPHSCIGMDALMR